MKDLKSQGHKSVFSSLAVFTAAGLILAFAGPALFSAQEPAATEKLTFHARLLPKEGGQSTMVKFEVNGLTTKEEVARFQQAFNSEGLTAFRTEFRKTPKATMKFYDGGSTIRFNAAYVEPGEKGTRITLFAEDRTLGTINNDVPLGNWFLIAVLDVDANGRGDGRIYHSALVNFTDDNRMELGTYRRSPVIINQVYRMK